MTPEFRQGESHVSPSERAYEAWLAKVEKLIGRSIVLGSAEESNAADAFAAGDTPADFVIEIEAQHHEHVLALEHAEEMADWAVAKARLGKLTVRELRLLHVHYFGSKRLAKEIGKDALIDDLVEEIVKEGR